MSEAATLQIEKPIYGGDCLAHHPASGKAVFVPLVLPGEQIEAVLREEKRNFLRAEATKITTPSLERTAPSCPYFGTCGGCRYQHAQYRAQLAMKHEILRETLTRAAVAAPEIIATLSGDPWHYRNRIRFAFTSGGQLAYRSRSSNALISVDTCPIAAPVLVSTALTLANWAFAHSAPTRLAEVELFCNHDAEAILITLHVAGNTANEALQRWLTDLHSALPAPVRGIRIELDDASLATTTVASVGDAFLEYEAAGFPYRVDSGAFFQVNRLLLDTFVACVLNDLPRASLAWDLYAGAGLFARQLTTHCDHVHAVEIAPASREALQVNLAGTNATAHFSTTLDYLRNNRERREQRPDLIVLDPPRAGLGPEVTQLLNAIHAPRMVYVSCDPATLGRDLKALTSERYSIAKMTLVDLFPQTFHMETVVHLQRS